MTASQPMIHPPPNATRGGKARTDESSLPPPAPFGPSTWKSFYYACLVATIFVGLGTVLNGGVWIDAIVRMFITLTGGSILAICFISFVIIPLHVKRYEYLVAAQNAPKQTPSDSDETDKKTEQEADEDSFSEDWLHTPDSSETETPAAARQQYETTDQAASLRRMTSGQS